MSVSSLHLVDQDFAALLANLPNYALDAASLPATRQAQTDLVATRLVDADRTVRVDELVAPGLNGGPDVPVLLYRPDGLPANAPVILQIHGGGMIFGSAWMGDARHRAWSKALGCAILSVDYRLAPESPYPAALHDCRAALEWLHAEAASLGLDGSRIVLRGESAGGLLAAALMLHLRDYGGPQLLLGMLIYPMLDDRVGSTVDAGPLAGEFVWPQASNVFGWTSWLGRAPGGDDIPHHAAPARANDLSGLPPTFIATGQLDLFLDEDMVFARRLIAAGVSTELHVLPGAFHGFDQMAPDAAVSRLVNDACLSAIGRAFARAAEADSSAAAAPAT
jgi:acetyl esterase/lipase